MKKLILLAGIYCLQPSLHAASSINEDRNYISTVRDGAKHESAGDRAMAYFKDNFSGASDVVWTTNNDGSINCFFRRGTATDRVYYDKRGYWQYTLVSYPPAGLANNVKYRVLDDFDSYTIKYVNEIRSAENSPVYMINIENEENIKVIRVSDDDIEVKQDLKRSR